MDQSTQQRMTTTELNEKIIENCYGIASYTLLEMKMKSFRASDVACCIIYAVRRSMGVMPIWSNELCLLTKTTMKSESFLRALEVFDSVLPPSISIPTPTHTHKPTLNNTHTDNNITPTKNPNNTHNPTNSNNTDKQTNYNINSANTHINTPSNDHNNVNNNRANNGGYSNPSPPTNSNTSPMRTTAMTTTATATYSPTPPSSYSATTPTTSFSTSSSSDQSVPYVTNNNSGMSSSSGISSRSININMSSSRDLGSKSLESSTYLPSLRTATQGVNKKDLGPGVNKKELGPELLSNSVIMTAMISSTSSPMPAIGCKMLFDRLCTPLLKTEVERSKIRVLNEKESEKECDHKNIYPSNLIPSPISIASVSVTLDCCGVAE